MNSAVLIIDLQVGLFEESGKPYDYEMVISKINSLISIAHERQIPVVFIQHETKEGVLKYNSPGWELVSDLDVDVNDYFVRKSTPNSFFRTNLNDVLKKEKVNNIIVSGYATEFCIDSTIRAAAALGYHIQIVSDGHTTHDKEHASAELIRKHHNVTLSDITSFDVKISAIEANELIEHIG